MANKGREYAENLVGALDRSAYGQQRDVAQNVYNTNWQNVQNQYKNLQDKLKLQQQRANRDFAEGLVDVAESSFNRQRVGSGNLANRGLSASGLTNILNQADTAQKGEDIAKLLKSSGNVSVETADKLGQATAKFSQESNNLMGKLANTLADVGDAETAAQNRYNQTLAGIAGAMDQREANNALQAAQRAASRGSGGGKSKALTDAENELEEFYKRATINEILSSPDMDDRQKQNYLGIIFGIDNAGKAVTAYNNNLNAAENYNKKLQSLQDAANAEIRNNQLAINNYNRTLNNNRVAETLSKGQTQRLNNDAFSKRTPLRYIEDLEYPTANYRDQIALNNFRNQGITYEDLAALLYGNR